MALQLSRGLTTKLLGTSSMKSLMEGGFLRIFTGSQPSTVESVETGSLIATLYGLAGTAGINWGTASSGSLPKNATTLSGTAGIAGVAGWFRFYDINLFTGVDSAGTAVRFDGDIGTVTGALKLSNTTFAVGSPVIIDSAQFTVPADQS